MGIKTSFVSLGETFKSKEKLGKGISAESKEGTYF